MAQAAQFGILYAEDFGDVAEPEPAPSALPPLCQDDIDRACTTAVQAAEAAWAHSAALRRTVALEALAAGLAHARQKAAQQAEAVADGVARTALGMLANALPHLCRQHGDAEVRALLHQVLPLVASTAPVVVRVHGGLAVTLADDLAPLGDDVLSHIEIRAADLPPGDARLTWDHGGLTRDSAAICAAIKDSLAQFDLWRPEPQAQPAPPISAPQNKRSNAVAQ